MALADALRWAGEHVFLVLGFLAFLLIAGGGLIEFWRRTRQEHLRAMLIQSMLQRGFSSQDISRVLLSAQVIDEANEEDSSSDEAEEAADADVDVEVRVVKVLTDNSYDASDIQRILSAARLNGRMDESTGQIIITLGENWTDANNIVSVIESRLCAPSKEARPQPACDGFSTR